MRRGIAKISVKNRSYVRPQGWIYPTAAILVNSPCVSRPCSTNSTIKEETVDEEEEGFRFDVDSALTQAATGNTAAVSEGEYPAEQQQEEEEEYYPSDTATHEEEEYVEDGEASSSSIIEKEAVSSSATIYYFDRRPMDLDKCRALLDRIRHAANGMLREEDIIRLLDAVKNDSEMLKSVEYVLIRHHLFLNPLEGKGFRVANLAKLTTCQTSLFGTPKIWLEAIALARSIGFTLTRSYMVNFLAGLKAWQRRIFHYYGRKPEITEFTCATLIELLEICKADGVAFDHVFYARMLNCITAGLSCVDRQNMYRQNFGDAEKGDHPRRDGLVLQWIVGDRRHRDYDYCVVIATRTIHHLLEHLQENTNAKIICSLASRLIDFYYCTDNLEDLIKVVEYCRRHKVNLTEDATSRLVQLALGFNHPDAVKFFIKYRLENQLSRLTSLDIYRLLMYYGKAGGGLPCPKCGDRHNHWNPSIFHWAQSMTEKQKGCEVLEDLHLSKSVTAANLELPQNRDWSKQAYGLLELSDKKGIRWSESEWRGFIHCCMNAPKAKALASAELVLERFSPQTPSNNWDEYLKTELCRLLATHDPDKILSYLERFSGPGNWIHDRQGVGAINALLCGTMNMSDSKSREMALRKCYELVAENNHRVFPFTRRAIRDKTASRLQASFAKKDDDAETKALHRENQIVDQLIHDYARLDEVDQLESTGEYVKDSAVDIRVMETSRHQQYFDEVLDKHLFARIPEFPRRNRGTSPKKLPEPSPPSREVFQRGVREQRQQKIPPPASSYSPGGKKGYGGDNKYTRQERHSGGRRDSRRF